MHWSLWEINFVEILSVIDCKWQFHWIIHNFDEKCSLFFDRVLLMKKTTLILYRRLLTQLESFKPGQKKASTPQSKDPAPCDSVRYELFYRPEQAQFSKNAKVGGYCLHIEYHIVLSFQTDKPRQTVQTLVRLLLNQGQHC